MTQANNSYSDNLRIMLHDDRRICRALRHLARAHRLLQSCILQSPELSAIQKANIDTLLKGCILSEHYTTIISGRVINDPSRLLPCYEALPF